MLRRDPRVVCQTVKSLFGRCAGPRWTQRLILGVAQSIARGCDFKITTPPLSEGTGCVKGTHAWNPCSYKHVNEHAARPRTSAPLHHGSRKTSYADPPQAHSSVPGRGAVPAAGAGRRCRHDAHRDGEQHQRVSPRCAHTAAVAGGGAVMNAAAGKGCCCYLLAAPGAGVSPHAGDVVHVHVHVTCEAGDQGAARARTPSSDANRRASLQTVYTQDRGAGGRVVTVVDCQRRAVHGV
eukprot:266984-Prymnesium_polylepis.1